MKIINRMALFWGNADVFSNWHHDSRPVQFTVDGIGYNCAEQFMMHTKALFFGDFDTAQQVMKTCDPREQKRLGRTVTNFDAGLWQSQARELILPGIIAKFEQNFGYLQTLFDPRFDLIVEASPYDKIWGVGLGADDSRILDQSKWEGLNLLGELLMSARSKLKNDVEQDTRYCLIRATTLQQILDTCKRHLGNIALTEGDLLSEDEYSKTDQFYCGMFRRTWQDLHDDVSKMIDKND